MLKQLGSKVLITSLYYIAFLMGYGVPVRRFYVPTTTGSRTPRFTLSEPQRNLFGSSRKDDLVIAKSNPIEGSYAATPILARNDSQFLQQQHP
jgi:hypothetical protein